MKKILAILSVFVLFLVSPNVNGQDIKYTVDVHGGYSWLDGVVGADFHASNFGMSVGWMPTKMPLSGERINSYSIAGTYYNAQPDEYGWYVSIGVASAGYRYQTSGYYNSEDVLPMTIAMIGIKSGGEISYFKLGGGYGWASNVASSWTFEVTLGYHLFGEL